MSRPVAILAALSLGACADFTPGIPATTAREPARGPTVSAATTTDSNDRSIEEQIEHAIAVFERGPAAIPAREYDIESDFERYNALYDFSDPFRVFDERVRRFIANPRVRPAVSTGCVPHGSAAEDWVTTGLGNDDPLIRLRALAVLMRVGAPHSVDRQWRTLCSLELGPHGPTFASATVRLRAAFSPSAMDSVLEQPIPHACHRRTRWTIRAAGVAGHYRALSRLTEIALGPNRKASLAAAVSIGELRGPVPDAALARCVAESAHCDWLAAHRLRYRDPQRLRAALLAVPEAKQHLLHGLHLARLSDTAAVPLLCRYPSHLDDEDLDAIIRLARQEHFEAIQQLPNRVPAKRRDRANQVVAVVRARLGL